MNIEHGPKFTDMGNLAGPTLRLRGEGSGITDVVVTLYNKAGSSVMLSCMKAPVMPWVLHGMKYAGDEYLIPVNDDYHTCMVWWGINKADTTGGEA